MFMSLLVGIPQTAEAVQAPTGTICNDNGDAIVRLYRAYFNRYPDREGLEYWTGIYQSSDLHNVAFWMSQSYEFRQRWSKKSEREFVIGLLYNNLLRREPDSKGLNFWLNDLKNPEVTRDKVALYWVQQPELAIKHPVSRPSWCNPKNAKEQELKSVTPYRVRAIPGGQIVDTNYYSVHLGTSTKRCSAASINANWMTGSTKDSANPVHIGIAVVNGKIIQSVDPGDRGVIGARYRSSVPNNLIDDWSKKTMVSFSLAKNKTVLENHYAWYTTSASNFKWAVSGVPIIVNGEMHKDLYDPATRGNYTYGTLNHSFIAVKPHGVLSFGATSSMNATQLAEMLKSQGYTDVMMLDGGGSTELNIAGKTVVAGTSRNPIWFGIGCG